MTLPGATASTYSTRLASPTESGATYRVLVKDNNGTTTSAHAKATVLATPGAPIILTNPV